MNLSWVARRQTAAVRWVPPVLYAVLAFVLAGGCAHSREGASASGSSQPTESPWALPTSTMRWNEYASELIARNQIGQFPAARTLAYTNLAINNGIVMARQQGHKPDGAAAGAAAAILAYLFPKEEQAIAGRLSGEMAALGAAGPRSDFAAGVEIGRAAASDVIAAAKSDRSALTWSGPAPTGPDKWSSRLQPPRPPLGPRLGEMRPFFVTTGSEFRTPGPPAADSQAFRAAVAEVRAIADRRTNEQLRIAQYWETVTGAYAAGLWNDVARNAISAHGLSEPESRANPGHGQHGRSGRVHCLPRHQIHVLGATADAGGSGDSPDDRPSEPPVVSEQPGLPLRSDWPHPGRAIPRSRRPLLRHGARSRRIAGVRGNPLPLRRRRWICHRAQGGGASPPGGDSFGPAIRAARALRRTAGRLR
jgi:hypothetical protein